MTTSTAPTTYELRVAGHLDDHWSATLGDLTLARRDDGTTTLTGPVVDQAQLHGILTRIRDLGAPLLSLRTVEAAEDTPKVGTCTLCPQFTRPGNLPSPGNSAGLATPSEEIAPRLVAQARALHPPVHARV